MVSKDDWRRKGQEKYLIGIEMEYIEDYKPYSESWEHEHCDFCMVTISAYDGDLHDGYCTMDEKRMHWICNNCFDDFKDEFKWSVKKK